MLYIIYGMTTVVRRITLDFFKSAGVEEIKKLTFETKDVCVKPSDGILHAALSEQEVRKCDYVYENHGRIVGFTSEQIESAVSGSTDAVLTFSSGDLSFLREIKSAFGDHVAIIFTYIEEATLKKLTNELSAPEEQKIKRLEMGKTIKQCYFSERGLFDETVIYGGEDSIFNLDSLKPQYDHIVKKYKSRERDPIPLPYVGNKPYIFVSYARVDTERVLPYLQFLKRNGCRIWYDKGIKAGDNWKTTLASKIKGCEQYIVFSSKASTASEWTQREISLASDRFKKPTIAVRMDDSLFNDGIEWILSEYQQLFTDSEDFEQTLLDSITDEVIEKSGNR